MAQGSNKSPGPPPHVDVDLSIAPSTHSFTRRTPPTFTITLTSRAPTAITIFTWGTPFAHDQALNNKSVIITDIVTNTPVPTASILVQRSAITRIRGSSDERYYLTLLPNISVTVSRPFGRGNGTVRPLPKSIVQNGWELDDQGNPRNIRRSTRATGVDGLEEDREYRVSLNEESLSQCSWGFGTKEEILVDERGIGSYFRDYPWNKGGLEFSVAETVLAVEE